jgi:hypothetical protein
LDRNQVSWFHSPELKNRVARLQQRLPWLQVVQGSVPRTNVALSPQFFRFPSGPFPVSPSPFPAFCVQFCNRTSQFHSTSAPGSLVVELDRKSIVSSPVPRSPLAQRPKLRYYSISLIPSFLLTRHLHVRFCPIVKYQHLPARTADAKPNRSSKDHPTRPHLQAFRLAP